MVRRGRDLTGGHGPTETVCDIPFVRVRFFSLPRRPTFFIGFKRAFDSCPRTKRRTAHGGHLLSPLQLLDGAP